MPKIALNSLTVKSLVCPENKVKCDFFDSNCRGLVLEVRVTGGKTYYLRFRSERGAVRQIKLANERDVTLAQARKMADRLRSQIAMGEDPLENKRSLRLVPTLESFIKEKYLPFAKTYKRSWATDECLLRNHVIPRFGHKHLDQIKKSQIVEFIAQHLQTHAPGSVNRVIILLRYLFNCAKRWEIQGGERNPTDSIPLLQENNKKERYLTTEEARRLYDCVCGSENKTLRFIVPMLILTGARKREVLDAQWEDFDLERRVWRIPTTKLGKPRYVPLSDGALSILQEVPRRDACPWVFFNPDTSKPYVSIFCAWDTARKKANLKDVRIHDLRHSFASLLINSGRSLYEVQKLLGHTQVKTTQRYAHLAPETLLDASNAATRAIGSLMGVMPNRVIDVPLIQAQPQSL